MKGKLLLLGVFFGYILFGQIEDSVQLAEIQKRAKKIKRKHTKELSILADKLCEGYNSDLEKVESISYWIARRIKYDVKVLNGKRFHTINNEMVLRKRKAICGEYSKLFEDLCAAQGIDAEIIEGYTIPYDFFEGDSLYRADHGWNIVRVNNQWHLMDITWSAGYVTSRKPIHKEILRFVFQIPFWSKPKFKRKYNRDWVFSDPLFFVGTHLPNVPDFQMLKNPYPLRRFENFEILNISNNSNNGSYKKNEIPNYTSLEKGDRLLYKADSCLNYNALNYRDKAIYKVEAIEEGVSAIKNPIDSIINDFKTTKCMNQQEFDFYKRRNGYWKKMVLSNNREHRSLCSRQRRVLAKEMALNKHLVRRHKANLRKLIGYRRYIQKQRIDNVRRTTSDSKECSAKAEKYKRQIAMSRFLTITTLLDAEDYQNAIQNLDFIESIEMEKMHYQNLKAFAKNYKIENRNRIRVFELIYRDSLRYLKTDVRSFLDTLIEVNKTFTLDRLIALKGYQKASLDSVKQFYSNTKVLYRAFKKLKKYNVDDCGEDKAFDQLNEESIESLDNYISLAKEAFALKMNSFSVLRKKRVQWNRIRNYTYKEDKIEKRRYAYYNQYRKGIKYRQNGIVNHYLKRAGALGRENTNSIVER